MEKNKELKINEVRRCKACGDTLELEEHHIIPTFMNKPNELETILLCRKHHTILHNMLNKFFWKNRLEDEESIIKELKGYTKWFCKMEWAKWHPKDKKFFFNHCILCRKSTNMVFLDFLDGSPLGLCLECFKFCYPEDTKTIMPCKKCGRMFHNSISNYPGNIHNYYAYSECTCPRCLKKEKR